MTIELITGTPGAGKTCYAVAMRINVEKDRQIAWEPSPGVTETVQRRVVVAGINGLAMPHERLPHTLTGERVNASDIDKWNAVDADGEPRHKRLPGEPVQDVEASLFNWWLWCKPGDLIVCDEVQFIIPRGTLGRTPPHYIKSLEIHRHYGVDFLFITQSATLLDSTIRNLVGLHRHVRPVVGGLAGLRMVYEWDHASNVERISQSVKTFYRTKPAYFKLYRSTVAVVAPPKSGRAFLWMVPLLLAFCALFAWKGTARWRDVPIGVAQAAPLPAGYPQKAPSSAVVPVLENRLEVLASYPFMAGRERVNACYAVGAVCRCIGPGGQKLFAIPQSACRESVAGFDGLVRWEPRDLPRERAYGASVAAAESAASSSRPY